MKLRLEIFVKNGVTFIALVTNSPIIERLKVNVIAKTYAFNMADVL